MARLHRNSLFAIEQSISKKASKPKPVVAGNVSAAPIESVNLRQEIVPVSLPIAPLAEPVAKPLQLGLSDQHVTMQQNGITIETHMKAQPLQSFGQSNFFDDPFAIEEASKPMGEDAALRQSASDVVATESAAPRRELNSQPSSRPTEGRVGNAIKVADDDDDFLSELDAITSMAASRREKKVPQQFSHEVDAFQKELDSMVGKPNKSTSEKDRPDTNNSEEGNDNSHYKGTSSGLSNHHIFEGNSGKKYANSFNLGTVNIGDRFDQFDIELEREDQKTRQKIAQDLGLSDFDVVADLSELSAQASDQENQPPNTAPEPTSKSGAANYQVPVVLHSEAITPWAAGAAMLQAWQGQWAVEELVTGESPWTEFAPLLATTQPEQLNEWGIEPLVSPQSFEEWQVQLQARGPLLLGSGDQVMVMTQLGDDCHLIRTDRGAITVGFDDFEEVIARLQLSGQFVVAALVSEQTNSAQRDSKDTI